MKKTICELFAGVGGFRLGFERLGSDWETVWFNQFEPGAKKQWAHDCYGTNIKANRFDITVNHAQVNSGNFKMVLVCNDEIVHEFTLNELSQSYTLENPSGYVALRIAGESADFMFDYSID